MTAIGFALLAAGCSSASGPSSKESPRQHALNYIADHGRDANRVQAYVMIVQLDLMRLQKQPTTANLNQLALDAQEAHDAIDTIRNNFAAGESDAELLIFSGANDLKNAMGAIVAYTNDPTPGNLASLTIQYRDARGEWNSGVRSIWRTAGKKPPLL